MKISTSNSTEVGYIFVAGKMGGILPGTPERVTTVKIESTILFIRDFKSIPLVSPKIFCKSFWIKPFLKFETKKGTFPRKCRILKFKFGLLDTIIPSVH